MEPLEALSHLDITRNYYSEAEELLETLSPEDREAWVAHPVTKSLKLKLMGDMSEMIRTWMDGGYQDEDPVMGSMKSLKGVTQIQDLHDFIVVISEMKKND